MEDDEAIPNYNNNKTTKNSVNGEDGKAHGMAYTHTHTLAREKSGPKRIVILLNTEYQHNFAIVIDNILYFAR